MQRMRPFLRTISLVTVFGLAILALPLSAHAWVRVGLGLSLPVPTIVAPAQVVVAPLPPVVVRPGYYTYYAFPRGYWWHRWHRW